LASADDFFAALNAQSDNSLTRAIDIETRISTEFTGGKNLKIITEELRAELGKVTLIPVRRLETAEATLGAFNTRHGTLSSGLYNSAAFLPVTNKAQGTKFFFVFLYFAENVAPTDPLSPPVIPDENSVAQTTFALGDFLAQVNAQGTALTYSLDMEILSGKWARENALPTSDLDALPGATVYDTIQIPVLATTEDTVRTFVERVGDLSQYNNIGVFRMTQNDDALYIVVANVGTPPPTAQDIIEEVTENNNQQVIVPPVEPEVVPDEQTQELIDENPIDSNALATGTDSATPDTAGGDFGSAYFSQTNVSRTNFGLGVFVYSSTLQEAANIALANGESAAQDFLAQQGIVGVVIVGSEVGQTDTIIDTVFNDALRNEDAFYNATYNALAISFDLDRHFVVIATLTPEIFAFERGETIATSDTTGEPDETGEDDDTTTRVPTFSSEFIRLTNEYREALGLERLVYSRTLQAGGLDALLGNDADATLQQAGIDTYVVIEGESGQETTLDGLINAFEYESFNATEEFKSTVYNAMAVVSTESSYYIVFGFVSADILAQERADAQAETNATTDPNTSGTNTVDSDGDGYTDDIDQCPFQGDLGSGVDTFGCPIAIVDSDFDGYTDNVDQCPFQGDLGSGVDTNGCALGGSGTDSDGDGFADNQDRCPTNSFDTIDGCSTTTDNDGDGYVDSDDECPYDFVTAETDDFIFPGCPKP
jgi:uncharacterized protein YkwD